MKIFCTLMLWLVLLKIRLARMALANLLAYQVVSIVAIDGTKGGKVT